ncbi:protein of unknown function [Candidatus Bipolaricaulis anaerobius]|uniref:Uncharacterized protein n=1 Tax=Candidatus Bipolaricaulis anaerobius TaxID=2026885 RepID=A0A2X3KXC0_9BACT|nr:protein of unknown function [Candidatus Bipolaricaulis anaerobius]
MVLRGQPYSTFSPAVDTDAWERCDQEPEAGESARQCVGHALQPQPFGVSWWITIAWRICPVSS